MEKTKKSQSKFWTRGTIMTAAALGLATALGIGYHQLHKNKDQTPVSKPAAIEQVEKEKSTPVKDNVDISNLIYDTGSNLMTGKVGGTFKNIDLSDYLKNPNTKGLLAPRIVIGFDTNPEEKGLEHIYSKPLGTSDKFELNLEDYVNKGIDLDWSDGQGTPGFIYFKDGKSILDSSSLKNAQIEIKGKKATITSPQCSIDDMVYQMGGPFSHSYDNCGTGLFELRFDTDGDNVYDDLTVRGNRQGHDGNGAVVYDLNNIKSDLNEETDFSNMQIYFKGKPIKAIQKGDVQLKGINIETVSSVAGMQDNKKSTTGKGNWYTEIGDNESVRNHGLNTKPLDTPANEVLDDHFYESGKSLLKSGKHLVKTVTSIPHIFDGADELGNCVVGILKSPYNLVKGIGGSIGVVDRDSDQGYLNSRPLYWLNSTIGPIVGPLSSGLYDSTDEIGSNAVKTVGSAVIGASEGVQGIADIPLSAVPPVRTGVDYIVDGAQTGISVAEGNFPIYGDYSPDVFSSDFNDNGLSGLPVINNLFNGKTYSVQSKTGEKVDIDRNLPGRTIDALTSGAWLYGLGNIVFDNGGGHHHDGGGASTNGGLTGGQIGGEAFY